VFVADSLAARRHNNTESLENLEENLMDQGKSIRTVPLVFQYNKRDLDGSKVPLLAVEELDKDLNSELHFPSFPASAITGTGVRETFRKICVMTVVDITRRLLKEQEDRETG
jgi:hypothetical protein